MIYNAEDKWNKDAPHLEHRADHKYYMKIGQGPTARYFYSAAEYMAYQKGLRSQVNREQQSASARNESRIIARQNVRANSRNSNDVMNLKNTNHRAQLDANKAVDRLQRTQIRKEQQMANTRNERTLAGKRREARKQAYVDFQRNRGKEPAPAQRKPMDDNRRIINRANSVKRSATQISNMKKANAAKQRAYDKAHPIETTYKRATKAANSAYKSASKAAKSAYKSAKKAYNSKQGKAVRKKVRKTAQSAYKRGSSFVKKLFGR